MTVINKELLKKLPKTDLHVHLDGSLRLETLIDLAKKYEIKLPSYTEDGLKELVFKDKYNSLDEYLKGFGYTCSVLRDRESLERVAYEFAIDNFNEGVRYIEVRFAPQLHMSEYMSYEDVMLAVDTGLKTAQREINSKIDLTSEPEFEYGIIVCAMRFFNDKFSGWYKMFSDAHRYSDQDTIINLASLELAKATARLRDESSVKIVGFDIAGSEYGYPASNHESSYDYIHKNFIHKTVHAGEAYGPESIFEAITICHADRIGHGLFLFEENMIFSEDIKDKKKFIINLANYIADRRITIEVCLTSNLQTTPQLKSIKDHSLAKMLNKNLSVTFCTDNRLVSNTTICNEIEIAMNNFNISAESLKNILIYGFKRSFFYGSYTDKRKYVRKVIDYMNKLFENETGVIKN